MIKTFGSKETEKVWNGERSKQLPLKTQKIGRRKLRMINNSIDLDDLRIPHANRFEKLTGDLAGSHSIRINRQWRIILQWKDGSAYKVEIIHYH